MKKIFPVLGCITILLLFQPLGGRWAYLLGIRWVYVFLLAFMMSIVFVPLCISICNKFKILDYPDERKIHTTPIPRLGGVAIFLGVSLTCIRNLQFSPELIGLLFGGALIFLIGVIDDVVGLSALVRFISQVAASLIAVFYGLNLTILPHMPFEYPLEVVLTVLWLVSLTNTINFLDGVDGLAASISIVCCFAFFVVALLTGQRHSVFITSAICGACLGFLFYNWHPAKVFMGDSGANYLGYMLGGIAIMNSWAEDNPVVAISTPILILSIPIYDLIYTTISRIKNGQIKNLIDWLEFTAKDHIHHRILNLGFSQPRCVEIILILNSLLIVGALTLWRAAGIESILLLFQAMLMFILISILMVRGRK